MFKNYINRKTKNEEIEKNVINLEFLEDLEKNFTQDKKKLKTEIFLSDNLFIMEELTYFDEEQYNIFDYIVEFNSGYFFAVSREVIDDIIGKMKVQNIYLIGIYLSYEDIKEIQNINFMSIDQRKEFIKEEINYLKYIVLIIITLVIHLFFRGYNNKIIAKIDLIDKQHIALKTKIKENQNIILNIEKKIEQQHTFEKNLMGRDTGVAKILNKIFNETIEDFFIESLTITKNQVAIVGSSSNLNAVYNFKKKLFNEGFKKINNDFIKNESGNILYKIDFHYYNNISKIEKVEKND
jgi:hypothetical protein